MDTSLLQVEWLGDEHEKSKLMDSSVAGHKMRVFRAKNCVNSGVPPSIIFFYF